MAWRRRRRRRFFGAKPPLWTSQSAKKVADLRNTNPVPCMNIAQLLWDASRARARAQAVMERESTTDYGTLQDRAGRVAGALAELGIGRDDRVALLLDRSADAAAAFFGVVAAGGVAVG